MTPPRFTPEQVQAILRLDPGAAYHPPSRSGAADDFLELSDGAALPNPTRATAWLQQQPGGPPRRLGRPGHSRPRLTLITGGSQEEVSG